MEFGRFFVRRLFWSIFVLIGLSIVIFVIARVVPGDPARIALGPVATAEQVADLRAEMGLDKPPVTQYLTYIAGLTRGDMGMSLLSRRSVSRDIFEVLPATVELVLFTMLLTVVVALPIGVVSGRFKDGVVDNLGRMYALIGVVMPSFLIALLLQLVAGYWVQVLPVNGRIDATLAEFQGATGLLLVDSIVAGRFDIFSDALRHLILPVLALSAASIGQITRITRSSVIDVSRKDYIEAARAFGLSEARVLFKYMLRPASIPALTILGLEAASLIANAFVVEMVFSWPGVASYGVRTILQKDFNAVMGVVIISGLFFLVANLVIDILVGFIDPRIRMGGRR